MMKNSEVKLERTPTCFSSCKGNIFSSQMRCFYNRIFFFFYCQLTKYFDHESSWLGVKRLWNWQHDKLLKLYDLLACWMPLFTDQVRSLGGRTFLNYDLKYTGALILDFTYILLFSWSLVLMCFNLAFSSKCFWTVGELWSSWWWRIRICGLEWSLQLVWLSLSVSRWLFLRMGMQEEK